MTVQRPFGMLLCWSGAAVVTLLLAAFASPFASISPDGLNKVAIDKGFDHHAVDSAVADSPLAGYAVNAVENGKVSKGLSGVAGVAITLVIASLLFAGLWVLSGRRTGPLPAGAPSRVAPTR